jgi:hypothetical protein
MARFGWIKAHDPRVVLCSNLIGGKRRGPDRGEEHVQMQDDQTKQRPIATQGRSRIREMEGGHESPPRRGAASSPVQDSRTAGSIDAGGSGSPNWSLLHDSGRRRARRRERSLPLVHRPLRQNDGGAALHPLDRGSF